MDDRETTTDSRPDAEADPTAGSEPIARPGSGGIEAAEPVIPAAPSMVDGKDHPVDPRSIQAARLIAVPLTLAIPVLPLVALFLVWALVRIPAFLFLGLLVTLLILASVAVTIAYRFPGARYRHLRYRVDADGLRIQRGVFWRKTIWISITRVQHTDVSQGPLQRRYDLATLTVHTAGTEGASIPLAGLEQDVATRLSEHLRPDQGRDAG